MAEDNTLESDVIVRLAIYFPILIEVARNRETIFYSSLQNSAAKRSEIYPKVEDIEVGQSLEWFRLFTDPRKLPDICALVVNKKTKRPGKSYDRSFEGESAKCYQQDDWKTEEFAEFLVNLSRFKGQKRHRIRPHF